MKDNKIYTVIFTVVLSCLCAFVLTFANVRWAKLIKDNESLAKKISILKTFNLLGEEKKKQALFSLYTNNVVEKQKGVLTIYEAFTNKNLLGYAMDILGYGKYGPIKGILTINENKKNIMALDIYQQNETPGLGGRIASEKWLKQFKNLPMMVGGQPGIIISSKTKGPNIVDAISGASKTTFSIQKIINRTIQSFFAGGMDLMELNLGLTADAVTRATPGYPKNLVKPPHLREEVRRPIFMVKPGVTNLALYKPVACSTGDETTIGDLEQINDDVKTSTEFDIVELDRGLQWIQIDLEAVYNISAVAIWHYYKNPTIYKDVIVQISSGPEFKENVQTIFNNDHDNSAGLGTGIDTAFFARWWSELVDTRGENNNGTSTRYVRVYTGGGTSGEETRFVEIAVYGQ